ncbi:MAG: hypothetical protein QM811_14090 [Pirellulales bacterium]
MIASQRIDVQLRGDIRESGKHLGDVRVPVDLGQLGIRVQIAAVAGSLENTFDGIFKDRTITFLGPLRRGDRDVDRLIRSRKLHSQHRETGQQQDKARAGHRPVDRDGGVRIHFVGSLRCDLQLPDDDLSGT